MLIDEREDEAEILRAEDEAIAAAAKPSVEPEPTPNYASLIASLADAPTEYPPHG